MIIYLINKFPYRGKDSNATLFINSRLRRNSKFLLKDDLKININRK